MNEIVQLFINQCQRELLLHWRQPKALLYAAVFLLMIMVFFPLTMTPEPRLLREVAAGFIWIAVLLALLLASERLFQQDYDDGVIEQWLVSGQPLAVIVFAKVSIHWLLNIIPVLLLCPLLLALFSLSFYEMLILLLSLLVGSPAIIFLCALAAALSTGIKQKGVLTALVLLPLAVPVMIFGSGTLRAAMQGLPVSGYVALLLALSIVAAVFLPIAIATLIRISLAD